MSDDETRPNLIGLPSMKPIDIDDCAKIMVEGLMLTKQKIDEELARWDAKVKTVFSYLEQAHKLPTGALGTTHQLMNLQIVPQPQAQEAAASEG